jgi:hypothetical protein
MSENGSGGGMQNACTRKTGIPRFSIWWKKAIQNQYLAVNKH